MEAVLAGLTEPLFRLPLITGLLLAALLPLLGCYLMLRDEWLAALGLAHLAGAGALLAGLLGLSPLLGGSILACLGAGYKTAMEIRGNLAYAFMILAGWSLMLLLAANTRLGESLATAMIDGQLYFAAWPELTAVVVLVFATALFLPWFGPRLLRARFFPRFEQANRLPAWRWHLGFDLLVALAMATATATLGLVAAFALILVPSWAAFRLASGWRWCLLLALLLGVAAYLLAFATALLLDQPFGPVAVMTLLLFAALVATTSRKPLR
jgi:zinc transport system permease protein